MPLNRNVARFAATAVAVYCLALAPKAFAYWDFRPTPLEWASWPEYCQVQYEWVNAGYFREYAGRFSEAQIDAWRQRVGADDFLGLHHYCASILFLSRARMEVDRAQKGHLLTQAYDNANYSFSRAAPTGLLYAAMAGTTAEILMEQGATADAMETLEASIRAQPTQPQPYLMLAFAHRKQGRLDLAKQVLEKATDAVGTDAVELQYNLGLINLEIGDVDAAVENAKIVYARDYPLAGLQNKLKKLGRWPGP